MVLSMSLYSWDEVPEERLRDDISRKIISGERVMAAHVFLKKGAVVPAHSHESEQMTYILEGLLELTLPSGTFRVGEGQVLVIPSNVEHSAVALEDTLDMDVFSPIREDWLTGEDHYLRGE
jgi:quercetin dioxygenase-like cupin family protein